MLERLLVADHKDIRLSMCLDKNIFKMKSLMHERIKWFPPLFFFNAMNIARAPPLQPAEIFCSS